MSLSYQTTSPVAFSFFLSFFLSFLLTFFLSVSSIFFHFLPISFVGIVVVVVVVVVCVCMCVRVCVCCFSLSLSLSLFSCVSFEFLSLPFSSKENGLLITAVVVVAPAVTRLFYFVEKEQENGTQANCYYLRRRHGGYN